MLAAIIRRLARDKRGTSAVEMGLICTLIVIAMLGALNGMAGEIDATWTHVATSTHNAIAGTGS